MMTHPGRDLSPLSVVVVDARRQFREYVSPAVARYALRHQYATVLFKSPFTIRLAGTLDSCPRPQPTRNARRGPEVIRIQGANTVSYDYVNPASLMTNVVEFFESVDRNLGGDGVVWAKSILKNGAQVVLDITKDRVRYKVPPITPGDPVCLTKSVPLTILRESPDLLEAVNAGSIKLMTTKEATAFFDKKASRLKTSSATLQAAAEEEAHRATRQKSTGEVDTSQRITSESVMIEDVIDPRVQHLCAQVHVGLKDNERWPVNKLLSELMKFEDTVTIDSLLFIEAEGYYPSVKKWARELRAEKSREGGLEPTTDDLMNDEA